ncbi:MAG: hypothetical protein ACYDAY_03680 [Candidatus Dormibacteria bacterium]
MAGTTVDETVLTQPTVRVRTTRNGYLCGRCGFTSMDPGICPRCLVPLDDTPYLGPEADLPDPDRPLPG